MMVVMEDGGLDGVDGGRKALLQACCNRVPRLDLSVVVGCRLGGVGILGTGVSDGGHGALYQEHVVLLLPAQVHEGW